MPKYLDQVVLSYAINSLAQSITNNFSFRKNTVRKIEVVDAIPTSSDSTKIVKCLKLTYDDDGYVNTSGTTVSHEIYISVDDLTKFHMDEWRPNTDYEVGDHVLYKKKMYVSNTQHTSSSSFDVDINNWNLVIGTVFEKWETGKQYEIEDYVIYDNKLFECNTSHLSTTSFNDDISNWKLLFGFKGFLDWQTGTDYYENDYVVHDNQLYKCVTNHTSTDFNTDYANWSLVIGHNFKDWIDNVDYNVGQYVVYDNKLYICNTSHTSTDFETDKSNWTLVIGNNEESIYNVLDYSSLPTIAKDSTICYCRMEYTDTSVDPNVTYSSGFYCYDKTNNKWSPLSSSIGGGELEEDVSVIGVTVGSVKDGDTFLKGTSFTDFAKRILQKRIPPTYTKPSVSLSTNSSSILQRGTNATITITPRFTQNDGGSVTGYELFRDGVSIYTDTAPSAYTDSLTNLSGTGIQYTCKVTYADGAIKNDNMGDPDSTGQILAGSVTDSATKINIALKYYYGKSSSNTISSLSALTGVLDTKKNLHLTFTANDEYLVLVYDSAYGKLSKIYDQNKFDNTSSWLVTTVTIDGFTYNVYVTNNKVTCSGFSYDFNY